MNPLFYHDWFQWCKQPNDTNAIFVLFILRFARTILYHNLFLFWNVAATTVSTEASFFRFSNSILAITRISFLSSDLRFHVTFGTLYPPAISFKPAISFLYAVMAPFIVLRPISHIFHTVIFILKKRKTSHNSLRSNSRTIKCFNFNVHVRWKKISTSIG